MTDDEWFCAVSSGNINALKSLSAQNTGKKDDKGRTALMLAAKLGYEDIVSYLLEWEKEQVDNEGMTALIYSFESDIPGICLCLAPYENSILDPEGRSPLSIAAHEGAYNSVTILLQYYDGLTDKMGYSPLDYCSFSGHTRILEVLLRSGLFDSQAVMRTLHHLNETSNFSLDCTNLLEQALQSQISSDTQNSQQGVNAALSNFPLPICTSREDQHSDENDSLLVAAFSVSQSPSSHQDLLQPSSSQVKASTEEINEASAPHREVIGQEDVDLCKAEIDSTQESKDSGLNFVLPNSLTGTAEVIDEVPNNLSSYSVYGTAVGVSSHYTEEDLAERDFGDALSRSSNDVSSYYMTKGECNVEDDVTGPIDFQISTRYDESKVQTLDSKIGLGATSLNERVLDSILREDFKLGESGFFLRSLNISGGADIVSDATQHLKGFEEDMNRLQAELQGESLDTNKKLVLTSALVKNLTSQLTIFKETTERLATLMKKTSADLSGFQSELQSRDNLIERLREQIIELKPGISRVADSCRDDRLTFTLHVIDRDDPTAEVPTQDKSDNAIEYQEEIMALKQKLSMHEIQLASLETLLSKKTEELLELHDKLEQTVSNSFHHPPQFEPVRLLEQRVLELMQLNNDLKKENSKYTMILAQEQQMDIEVSAENAAKGQRILELEGQVSSLQQICAEYEELTVQIESKSIEIACLHEALDRMKSELEDKNTAICELNDQLSIYQRNAQIAESKETKEIIERQREEISRLDSLLVGKNEELKVLTLRLADLEFKLTESEFLRTTAREADIDGPSKEDEINDTTTVVAALQNIELTTILRQTEASYAKLKQEHKALQQQLSEMHTAEKTATCQKCKILQVRNATLTEESEAYKAEITQLKYEIRACVEQITAAHATATSYKSKLGSKEREVLDCQKEIDRLLRINSQLNERLLQPAKPQYTGSPTRPSYSSLGTYTGYSHSTRMQNPSRSASFISNYKPRLSYMPSTRSSPHKSPQIRDVPPSLVTAQYAAQLSEAKSYQPTLGLLPKREYNPAGPGIVATSFSDLSIPRQTERLSPPASHPSANPDLYNAHKRIMNASLLDALAMSGYTTENLRNAGY